MNKVNEFESGPELDARVARILGWEVRRPSDDLPYQGKRAESEVFATLPAFSSSHEAAARIKEFLYDKDVLFDASYIPFEDGELRVDFYTIDLENGATANSEPLALCRFLVKLDEEDVINGD